MPSWLISLVLPTLINLALSIGVPALEAKFPALAPLFAALLAALHPSTPATAPAVALHQAAQKFSECQGAACAADTGKGA